MTTQPSSQRHLLAVFAHPDDETFGPSGALALYAQRGVETYLVCATRGEVGAAPADLRGYASVAEMREAELRCASRVLGLKGVRFLGYRDSGMAGSPENTHPDSTAMAPLEEIARKVAWHMREIRPQVVITFDPNGGYGHPDHIAVHRATVEAFRLASDPQVEIEGQAPYSPQKLYYHTFPRGWLRPLVRFLQWIGADVRHFGQNRDIDLFAVAEANVPVHAVIQTRSVAQVKAQAMHCHASQTAGMPRIALTLMAHLVGRKEYFSRAVPVQSPLRTERDLLEGVLQG